MSRWPNLFIAGAPRCGTTSLHSWLPAVPGIFMSRIKEPNYFSRTVIGEDNPLVKPIRSERDYLRLFRGADGARFLGEATPFYLEDPEAPRLIRRKSPDARIIVSLRDPVERLYSHYLMLRNNVSGMGTFMEEIERGLAVPDGRNLAVLDPAIGLYSEQIRRYRREFGDKRVKVLIFEEWVCDPVRTMQELSRFLGLEPDLRDFDPKPQRRYAKARGPLVRYLFGNRRFSRASEALVPFRLRKLVRKTMLVKETPKPPMEQAARDYLSEFYRDDVRETERLLGRRLHWRNFRDQAEPRRLRAV